MGHYWSLLAIHWVNHPLRGTRQAVCTISSSPVVDPVPPGNAGGGARSPAGGLENLLLLSNCFQTWHCGIPRGPNGLYGTQEAFGQAGFAQTPPENCFTMFFLVSGKLRSAPGPPAHSLLVLCGPCGCLLATRAYLYGTVGYIAQCQVLCEQALGALVNRAVSAGHLHNEVHA